MLTCHPPSGLCPKAPRVRSSPTPCSLVAYEDKHWAHKNVAVVPYGGVKTDIQEELANRDRSGRLG